jgi:RNase H-like domain found in reverse transcriptase
VHYDVNKSVTLQYASQAGIGCAILQDSGPVKQSYAQIEKEMLAILFALERFHTYVYAMPNVRVETDHKPLMFIYKKALSSAPKRLQ